jgi:hypothetical protein
MLLASTLVLFASRLHTVFMRSYMTRTVIFFVVTRFGLMVLIIMMAGHLVGPDKLAWVLHGSSALKGHLPYLDYRSEYGPFLSYLLAPAFLLFDPYMAPIIVFVFFDFLAFVFLGRATEDSDLNRRAASLYLITPLSWIMVVRYGQDDSIGAFLLVLMLALSRMNKRGLLTVVAGLGASASKILLMLPALPIVIGRTRRLRGLVIACSITVICYLPFYLMGGDVFQWRPGPERCGGPNLWALLELPMDKYYEYVRVVAGTVMLALVAAVIWRIRTLGCINGALVLYSALMILSPKAWPPYALLVLPLICLKVTSLGRRFDLILLSLYSFTLLLFLQIGPPAWAGGQPAKWFVSKCCTLFIVGYHSFLLWMCSVKTGVPVGSGGPSSVTLTKWKAPGPFDRLKGFFERCRGTDATLSASRPR